MADTQETIADIIAEMRGMGNYQRYSGDHARVLANRLDAAHRREVATTKESLAVGNSGDSAKLREAVGYILKYADSVACRDHDEHTRHYIDQIRKWAQSALAAPPRNCDRYNDRVEMYGVFKDWCNARGHTMEPKLAYDAFEWLLATATEKEGGNDADK